MIHQLDERERLGADCLSDLALDRLRLEQLDDSRKREQARAHLGRCARCRDRMAGIEAAVAPPIDFRKTLPRRNRWGWRALWLAPILAGATAVALLAPTHDRGQRSKGGGWQLGLVAQYPSGRVAPVFQGQALSPGDSIRFQVSAPSDGFVSVISLDATGAVTPFVPATGNALAIHAGKRVLLDGAVRLDDAIGPERLMLLACPRPIAVAEVVAAGRAALVQAQGRADKVENLALPCAQTSFWIRKEALR
jgi:hypothetical protein